MFPIVAVPEIIRQGLAPYRPLFCREAGFAHIGRYVTGLILSPNKTLQGIYALQVWEDNTHPGRRAMHEAIFEAGWDADALMPRHRAIIAPAHRGQGRAVLSLDWTYAHHERGLKIWGVKKAWDHVEQRLVPYQTVVTAVIANRTRIDGVEVVVQPPDQSGEEMAYLQETMRDSYTQMAAARERLLELLHHRAHRLAYKKRTEMAVEIVQQLEQEGHFPQAPYAFDNGVLTLELTRLIEGVGKHWVSELESSRHIQWFGQWRRVDEIAATLRQEHPESFRPVRVRCRNGDIKPFRVFTKVVRLKRYGRKRLVIVHEAAELTDVPRFLVTDALHWESGRVLETWSYRWASEIFHEFSKQVTGLEAAQVRKEEAVQRHFRLSCVAQSLIQQASASGAETERFAFAKGETTFGQRCRTIARDVMHGLLQFVAQLLRQGRSCGEILEMLIPA